MVVYIKLSCVTQPNEYISNMSERTYIKTNKPEGPINKTKVKNQPIISGNLVTISFFS